MSNKRSKKSKSSGKYRTPSQMQEKTSKQKQAEQAAADGHGIVVEVDIPDFSDLPATQLAQMKSAAEGVSECYRVLKKGGMNIAGEILRGMGKYVMHKHYPKGDVYDPETFSQYYYHTHRATGEYGHFHTFLRAGGIPEHIQPVPYDGEIEIPLGKDALTHFICISMNEQGFPIALFAVNRWVTGETWYKAEDVIEMLPKFDIDHAYLSWPVNRWITAMLQLFRPQIEGLLKHRDLMVQGWQEEYPDVDVYEDRRLEITGEIPISVEDQIEELEAALEAQT